MRETYTALGYDIMELPRTDIATRADFVCGQLARLRHITLIPLWLRHLST